MNFKDLFYLNEILKYFLSIFIYLGFWVILNEFYMLKVFKNYAIYFNGKRTQKKRLENFFSVNQLYLLNIFKVDLKF